MSKHPVDNLRQLVQQGIPLVEAASQLGIPYQTAYYHLHRKKGPPRKRGIWSEFYEKWRLAYRAGASIREIASQSGASTMAVRTAIRGLARSLRRKLGRPDYFDALDSAEKAYWFGLWWADGSINDKRPGQAVVQIGLTQHDNTDPRENEVGLLETFRQTLDTDYAIGSTRNKKGTGDALHLAIVSDRLAAGLQAHGLMPRKSKDKMGLVPIGLPDDFVPAFARGLLDGDGSMYLATRTNQETGHVSWTIQPRWTGGYNVLEWMMQRLHALGLVEQPVKPTYAHATCSVYLAPHDARRVIKAMYDAPGPSLRRKREKAMSLITDLHPQDWQDNEDNERRPPRNQTPLSPVDAGRKGAAARWGVSEEKVRVEQGDAFKILPKMDPLSVDLVLTDFPYSQESRDRGRREWNFDPFTFKQTKRALALCGRVSRGWVIVATMDLAFIGRLRDDCPKPLRFVRASTWEKEDYFRPGGDAEYIGFFRRVGVASEWHPPAVFRFKSNGHGGHPCSKPNALYAEIIRQTTAEGALVLDPFCGSGTVGRAAVLTGRRAILIDKETPYVEMAKRSIL